jgi:ABC-type branched-subunit amino acid transport system substrate-binding protein
MRTGTIARATALSGAALLALTACGGSDDSGDSGGSASSGSSSEKQVNVYGTDGNMGNALGEDFTEQGALAGMKGTLPLTELSGDFKDRLKQVDPNLQDYNYSAESYDATMLIAMAAQSAGNTQATAFGPYVNALTVSGEKCSDFAACLAIINAGGDVDYDGVSGPLSFTDAGEPAQASFGLEQFGDDNKIDDSKTKFVIAGDEANATKNAGPAPVAAGATSPTPLTIGTLLPETGNLAFLGPPEVAGVQLAINDINAAGGVLNSPAEVVPGDSGDASTNIATQTVASLLQQGVNAIIGAASSDVTKTVIDTVTQAGVLQFSPANTSDAFTTYQDNGLYFRTAPPDLFQGQVLADLVSQDGNQSVGILAQNGEYGTGLAERIVSNLESAGLSGDSVKSVYYDPTASDFSDVVQQMVDFNPDGIVVVGFDESAKIIKGLNEQGIGPQR